MKNKILVVPNVASLARKLTQKTQIGVVVEGFLSLKLASKIKFIIATLPFLPLLFRKDFSAGVMLLVLIEYFSKHELGQEVYLHNQMFDMAMVFDRRQIVNLFADFFSKDRVTFGFLTANPQKAIKFLSFCNLGESKVSNSRYTKNINLIKIL